MRVAVREIFCIEWELGREILLDDNHSLSIVIYVGPENSDISESFTLTLCNTDYVKRIVEENGGFNSPWYLIMDNAEKENVCRYLSDIISNITGQNWTECVQKLRFIGRYEFDEYQEP